MDMIWHDFQTFYLRVKLMADFAHEIFQAFINAIGQHLTAICADTRPHESGRSNTRCCCFCIARSYSHFTDAAYLCQSNMIDTTPPHSKHGTPLSSPYLKKGVLRGVLIMREMKGKHTIVWG